MSEVACRQTRWSLSDGHYSGDAVSLVVFEVMNVRIQELFVLGMIMSEHLIQQPEPGTRLTRCKLVEIIASGSRPLCSLPDVERSCLEMELMVDSMLVSRKAMHTQTKPWQQAQLIDTLATKHRTHHASFCPETRSLVRWI